MPLASSGEDAGDAEPVGEVGALRVGERAASPAAVVGAGQADVVESLEVVLDRRAAVAGVLGQLPRRLRGVGEGRVEAGGVLAQSGGGPEVVGQLVQPPVQGMQPGLALQYRIGVGVGVGIGIGIGMGLGGVGARDCL